MLNLVQSDDKLSYEHTIEHNKSIASYKIYLEPNYANLAIKIIYKLWHNCSSHEHNIEHNRQIFEHCLKA